MFIRISAFVLSGAMLFSQAFLFGDFFSPAEYMTDANPFAQQDNARRASIEQSVNASLDLTEFLKDPGPVVRNVDTSYLVKFLDTYSLLDMASILEGETYEFLGYSENRMIRLTSEDIDAFQAKAGTGIEFCEKDQLLDILPSVVPNDAFYEDQYAHDILNIPEAWNYSIGSDDVIIAVLDSGISRDHPDLSGTNILPGKSFIHDGSPVTYDDVGHGTMVTGVIAAVTDNEIGVAGICKEICIMPMQIGNSEGLSDSAIVAAIYDSADAGVDVISMSFGGYYTSSAEIKAVKYAYSKNCILVAASGNEAEYGEDYSYPASYPEVISVASVGETGSWSDFSTYNDAVDLAAPGEDIITTYNNDYYAVDGTSFSCPEVSAIAALARSMAPDLSPSQFLSVATATANDVTPAGYDKYTGYGIIDAEKLLMSLDGTRNFVTRLYQLCLGREPDKKGLDSWCYQLSTKSKTGADVAYGFIFSEEFLKSKKTNDEYVDILYKAFFNRSADASGRANWMNCLSSGLSRTYVLSGFIGSSEFSNLCASYGITAGSLALSEPRDLYPQTALFVSRFYQECLGRTPDTAGLNQWVNDLQSGKRTGATVAYGFIYSQEFINKKVSNENFVTILYKAFFNRAPDKAGYDGWVKQLKNGADRKTVLAGFVNSQEFVNLAAKYGIQPGTL